MTEVISVRVSDSLYKLLQELAQKFNVKVSDIVRDALRYYLENVIKELNPTPELLLTYTAYKVEDLVKMAKRLRYLHHVFERAHTWEIDLDLHREYYNEKGYHPREIGFLRMIEQEIKKEIAHFQAKLIELMEKIKKDMEKEGDRK
ncbi:MAG: ribbon-helix-helix protein, CopG family [Candidatus Njordarchaeales archaeon]